MRVLKVSRLHTNKYQYYSIVWFDTVLLLVINSFRTDMISHSHFCLLTSILAHEVQRRGPVYGIDGHIRISLGLAFVTRPFPFTAITDEYNILLEGKNVNRRFLMPS